MVAVPQPTFAIIKIIQSLGTKQKKNFPNHYVPINGINKL